MRPLVLVCAALLLAAGCADDSGTPVRAGGDHRDPSGSPPGDHSQRYTATATVLESHDHGPQLCLSGVQESYPPQCGGPEVVGWDWGDVDDKESASGTTWGTYTVVGTWDGERFTLTEPPQRPQPRDGDGGTNFTSPCEPPPGGWQVRDPAKTSDSSLEAAMAAAREEPDFAGAWIDQSINPASQSDTPEDQERRMNDPTLLVLNLRFTGDLEPHEHETGQIWGGALCITAADHTEAELREIQTEVTSLEGVTFASVDVVANQVELGVVFDDGSLQATLDERYGEGTVEVASAIRPADLPPDLLSQPSAQR